MLEPVDGVEFTVLVDNVTDSLSSLPEFVETEFAGLREFELAVGKRFTF